MRLFKSIVFGILSVIFCFAVIIGLVVGVTLFPGYFGASLVLFLLVSIASSIFYEEVFNETK